MLNRHPSSTSHEQLFVERYAALLAAAKRLTDGQRERAEELVQDAFIQFTLTEPNLSDIRNLDGYLFGILRKLHLSQVRRAARAPEVLLSAIDHDSVDMSLSQADARLRQLVVNELAAICAYACERKSSSKAASVLILRFFHGYYPSEIAQILRIDVRAVDEWRRIARREAKAALVSRGPSREFYPDATTLADVLAVIFRSRVGDCLTPAELSAYGPGTARQRFGKILALPSRVRSTSAVDCTSAAHIVSCERCLNEISRRLGIATLDERSAEDNLGPGRRGDDPPGPPGSSAASGSIRSARRKGRQVFEHRPEQLHIAVNGLPLLWQSIGAESIDQHVNVTTHESIEFVEVFSEQGVRLLFLNALPPAEATPVQTARASLSDHRSLSLALSFANTWPSLHLTYCDPADPTEPLQTTQGDEMTAREPLSAAFAPRRAIRRHRWAIAFAVLLLVVWLTPGASATTLAILEGVMKRIDAALHQWLGETPAPRNPVEDKPARPPTTSSSPAAPNAHDTSTSVPIRAAPSKPLAFAELASLEIDVLRRLDGMDALLGERLTVTRDPDGVRVSAIAETRERAAEIKEALAPLAGKRGLHLNVATVAERLSRTKPPQQRSLVLREVQVERDTFPARDAVRGYVESRIGAGPSETIDRQVRDFASDTIRRSGELLAQTWAIQRLAAAFSAEEQRALAPDQRGAWRALVERRARLVGELALALRTELQAALDLSAPEAEPVEDITGVSEELSLNGATERLAAAAAASDSAVRAAFTARHDTTDTAAAPPLGPDVIRSMREVERLAAWLVRRDR
jgi:RNA polymerase sigma factor (sigma-70 family)